MSSISKKADGCRHSSYWWSDTGAIDSSQVVISYAGLLCFGETDWDQGSSEDEPYVTIGVAPLLWGVK